MNFNNSFVRGEIGMVLVIVRGHGDRNFLFLLEATICFVVRVCIIRITGIG